MPKKIDVGRLLLILVTRNIALSNTLYSVLFKVEGAGWITIGSEWVGSLVHYEENSICYSQLFAKFVDDPFYTSPGGILNDECEYFANGIINDEKIFIQSFVFDTTFEVEFIFGEDLSWFN